MQRNYQYLCIWLGTVAFLIVSIVLLGGYTRLSGSGLSIVEWKPISGIIPPLNDYEWNLEFGKYKMFPEYSLVNSDIALHEFKFIFMIEFLHRILGRVIGLAFVLPLIYFYTKKIIPGRDMPKYLLMLTVLCLQGFMGWYMVKSGLYQEPYVSHYRLSVHLTIAVTLYALVIWQMLQYFSVQSRACSYSLNILLLLVFVQIFFGGMVAGLKAGLVYGTFPLMGSSFIPHELDISNLNDAVTVQFIHRIFAYLVFVFACYLSWGFYRRGSLKNALILFIPCLAQVVLGILTLLYFVPMSFALAHQVCAIALVTSVLYLMKLA